MAHPSFTVEFAPGVAASTPPTAPQWVDVSSRVRARWSCEWGRRDEFSESGAGTAELLIANNDGAFDPDNPSGAYYGDLLAGTWVRILGGTSSADTDVFYGHVSDRGFQLEASQFPDSFVRVDLVDDLEQLANTDLPESVYLMEVEADGPRAWYRLGEASGTVATDSSGGGHHGVYEGGATFNSRTGLIAGSADAAIGFDGDDDAIALPSIITTADWTVEAWVTRAPVVSGDGDGTIFEQGGGITPVDALSIFVGGYGGNDGKVTVFTSSAAISSVRVDDDAPHHIVVRCDAGDVTVWIDGFDRTTSPSSTAFPIATTWGALIGRSAEPIPPTRSFHGTIDEVAIYDSALDAARIAVHYAAGTAPWGGDMTGERINKLLDAVGYPSALRNIDAGSTTLQAASLGGGDALSAIRDAAKAEGGFVYIDHRDGGKLRFVGRRHRWEDAESVTAQAMFGDGEFLVPDSSGNGRSGTPSGSALPVPVASPWGAGFGSAMQFDGVDRSDLSSGVTTSSTGLMPTAGLTYRLRFRNDDPVNVQVPMGVFLDSGTPASSHCALAIITDQLYVFWVDNAGVVNALGPSVALGSTLHEAEASFNGSVFRLFLDGALVATSPATTLRAPSAPPAFWIGRAASPTVPYSFEGIIDEVEVANVARHAAGYVPSATPWTADASTLLLWHFDAGAEVPYDAVALEDDRVFNRATMQRANGAAVTVSDPVSEASRRRSLNESGLLYETDAESQYRAERAVSEKKDRHRVPRSVTLRPRKPTHPAWPQVFARSVDDRVVVCWRPPYGGVQTFHCWVDGISHRWDVDTGLDTTMYLSRVPFDTDGAPYWIAGVSTAGVTTRPGY